MTDKEIIIDGVNVADCNYAILPKDSCPAKAQPYAKETSCIACKEHNTKLNFCKNNPNCYYKQLRRKEQECKLLKATLKDKNFVAVMEENEKLKQECGELKKYKDVVNKLAGLQVILTNKDKMPELYENAKDLKIDCYKQALEKIEKIALEQKALIEFLSRGYNNDPIMIDIINIINEVKG